MPQVQDTALWYFRSVLGRTGGHLSELEYLWLGSLGFNQLHLSERWQAYFAAGNTLPAGFEGLITVPSAPGFVVPSSALVDRFSAFILDRLGNYIFTRTV